MAAVSDIQLLSRCAEFTLSHAVTMRQKIRQELETSAATSLIMGLRMTRLQGAVLSIGMFSLFESLLQTHMGWREPFDEVLKYLKLHGCADLAEAFNDYRLAVNVLKHGEGPSYERLTAKTAKLEFRIKAKNEPFFCEGDVSEVNLYIDVDETFVRRCAALIEEVASVIRSHEQVWI